MLRFIKMNIQLEILILVISIWSVFWKGVALFRAASERQKFWFVVLFIFLIVNSVGIIELIYLFKFAKKPLTLTEIKTWPNMLPKRKKK